MQCCRLANRVIIAMVMLTNRNLCVIKGGNLEETWRRLGEGAQNAPRKGRKRGFEGTVGESSFLQFIDYRPWISALIILVIGLMLYASSLNLLLFSDDAPHMQWLSNQQSGSYWLSSEGFPVYRPATFAAWDVLVRLLGGPDALAFHGLSVLLHLVNGLLVAEAAAFLTRQRRIGLVAGLLFVAFPFSYGAVTLAAAQFHLWQLFGILAGSRLMLGWLDARRGWWRLALAWLLIAWAIFQHENGVLAPALVGGILISHEIRTGLRAAWKRLALALGPAAGIAIVYVIMRALAIKADASELQLAALEVKVGQTFQVMGFPLAALFRLVFNPENGLGLAWLSGVIFLAVISLWAYRQWNTPKPGGQPSLVVCLSVLGIGWFFLAMLLAWLFVPVDYLLGSVRLHYLASAGLAWTYAAILTHPLPQAGSGWRRWLVGGPGLGICLIIAVPFIWARQAEFRKMDTVYHNIGEIARQMTIDRTMPLTQSLMVLNGPSVTSPPRLTFLLGSEGSVYLPDYVSLEALLWVNGFISEQHPLEVEMRHTPDVSPAIAVDAPELDRSVLADFDAVVAVQELDGSLHTALVGKQLSADSPSSAPLADFENGIRLEDGSLEKAADAGIYLPGSMSGSDPTVITLRLEWMVSSPPQQPVEIFVHLLCDGEQIAQADGPALGRVYPFALWQPDERWRDIRYFVLPADRQASCLHVLIGLYDPATGNRIAVTDSAGHSVDGVSLSIREEE